LTFLGQTLGASQQDQLSVTSQSQGGLVFQNLGTGFTTATGTITNVTEPGQELVVTSQIPNAFSYAGQSSSTVTYDLTPYVLNDNTVVGNSVAGAGNPTNVGYVTNVVVNYATNSPQKWINATYPLQVLVTGYASSTASATTQQSVQIPGAIGNAANTVTLTTSLYNVTSITLQGNKALPTGAGDSLTVNVVDSNALFTTPILLAQLASTTPGVFYPLTGKVYSGLSQSNVIYNQQNGQPTTTLQVGQNKSVVTSGNNDREYYTFQINETKVPGQSQLQDAIGVGVFNSSSGAALGTQLQLNYSLSGSRNNVTYMSSAGAANSFNVNSGFVTERGSKIATVSASTDQFDLAESIDWLQFAVAPSSSNTAVSHTYTLHGPYSVGQATNIPNVSIAKVAANITLSSSNYTITGINNITATPSVTSATTPVWLKNLSSTQPLVVLDTQASSNPASSLILIGSGYVNTLSKQLQTSYNISVTPSSAPITQAYGSNKVLIAGYSASQTTAAANAFIEQLYAAASSSTGGSSTSAPATTTVASTSNTANTAT
jgi:hypothetical protein